MRPSDSVFEEEKGVGSHRMIAELNRKVGEARKLTLATVASLLAVILHIWIIAYMPYSGLVGWQINAMGYTLLLTAMCTLGLFVLLICLTWNAYDRVFSHKRSHGM